MKVRKSYIQPQMVTFCIQAQRLLQNGSPKHIIGESDNILITEEETEIVRSRRRNVWDDEEEEDD